MKALLAVALILISSTAASAIGMCGLRAPMVAALKNKYQEDRTAIALAGEGNLVEVFASLSGTWTILITPAVGGKTCVIAAGNSWEQLPFKPEEKEL